jgi:uncharacterized protein
MSLDRRGFFRHSAEVGGRALAGFAALNALSGATASAAVGVTRPVAAAGDGGYGPLKEAGKELSLPKGFSYEVLGVEMSVMSDGCATPGRHDGMCAFPLPNGNIRLIRNHEVENQPAGNSAVGDVATAYDPGAGGGTTSLEIDPVTREVVRDFVSLNGTWRNCAGGPTPWGTWLSCEEAFFGPESGFGQRHGYVFEVPVTRERSEITQPIIGMGRFVHEAVAVDPTSGIVYQTEDHFQAGCYRFLPNEPYRDGQPGNLHAGGRLQMLAILDRPRYETHRHQHVGRSLPVTWVDIADPNPLGGPNDFQAVFNQGYDAGGARFSRLEGAWYANGNIYIVSTSGGDRELGQVWQYRPEGPDGGVLTLIFESRSRGVLKRPDNMCVSPNGCILVCEDANERRQYLRGITPEGRVFDIAANIGNDTELAGVTFSPDGRTLFFNILGDVYKKHLGMTVAVWGPWENGAI